MKKTLSTTQKYSLLIVPAISNDTHRSTPYQYTVTGVSDSSVQTSGVKIPVNNRSIVIKPIIVNTNPNGK